MLKIKIYKYNRAEESNGYRGEDYSAYVLQGFQDTEDITQEMDTSEITLAGVSFQKEFDPETKFIIDVTQTNELGEDEIVKTLDRVCSRDMVEQLILSDDTYFNHHLSLVEPSVIAQKRVVDNISTTYKLKDVTLEQTPIYPSNNFTMINDNSSYTSAYQFGQKRIFNYYVVYTEEYFIDTVGKYFEKQNSNFVLSNLSNTTYTTQYNELSRFSDGQGGYQAKITIPKMAIYYGEIGTTNWSSSPIGYASLQWKINEYDLNNDSEPTNTYTGTIISNSDLGATTVYQTPFYWQDKINGEWLLEDINVTGALNIVGRNYVDLYFKKYTDKTAPTPSYDVVIPVQANKVYKIEVSPYQFEDNIPSVSGLDYSITIQKYTGSQLNKRVSQTQKAINIIGTSNISYTKSLQPFTTRETNYSSNFVVYAGDVNVVYASSAPYSALALLQKAIINSTIYQKKNNVYIADVNNNDLPFVIDENYIGKLSATRIIENFYNQKNLWEIMLEVGHYIHAIPELKFGADDKFVITFNELGRTDQKTDYATKMSIFNTRSVEDYISATSSYVSNMVQLGGYIEEWVAPKTSDDTLLVSNDTASIITSKPIIELLDIVVKANKNMNFDTGGGHVTIYAGETAELTPFIYEENVYKTLSVEYNDVPNRGIAMYYKLGTNEITGGQYQLPRPNTDIYSDYAFKKIIYSAYFGYDVQQAGTTLRLWDTLKVKDFTFFVRYRTKDTVRQSHSRPDLRKYLLNSKYDNYPQHNQFNNQQDTLVDSIKFGNNVYGKLIKTGNSEYIKNEWVDDCANLKQKGELYRINGDLYYVAQVTNIYYSSHITSEIKFSKDYNELSAVIGIPSEPRFYEISEQSSIVRELAINDLFLVTNKEWNGIMEAQKGFTFKVDHIKDILFGGDTGTFAKYALSIFKGDKDAGVYDQTVGQKFFYKEILTPINAYSSENTLTYEWDMIDNYSAGDKVLENVGTTPALPESNNSLRAVGYTDIYGKSALLDFFVVGDIPALSTSEILALPESPLTALGRFIGDMNVVTLPTDAELENFIYQQVGRAYANFGDLIRVILTDNGNTIYYLYNYIKNGGQYTWQSEEIDANWTAPTGTYIGDTGIVDKLYAGNCYEFDTNYNGRGIGLLKDCRETISVNYNLQLITASDTFVLSPFVFLPNKQDCCIVLLNDEVNKLSNGYIDISSFITPKDTNDADMSPYFYWNSSTLAMLGNLAYRSGWNLNTQLSSAFQLRLDQILANVNEHHFDGTDGYQQVKAIAIICNVNANPSTDTSGVNTIPDKQQFSIARNIAETETKADAIHQWTFGTPNTNLYTNRQ